MICKKCEVDKLLENFYDWDRNKCKECRKKLDKDRYPERKEYLKQYYQEWYKNNKKQHIKNGIKHAEIWRKNNQVKVNAESRLRKAVQAGKIIKPDVCSLCPITKRIEGHHPDYSKPLEVIWLCRSCHKRTHLALNK